MTTIHTTLLRLLALAALVIVILCYLPSVVATVQERLVTAVTPGQVRK